MTNFVKVIQACENAGGAGKKDAVKKALATADTTAQRLIKEALNPFRVFGIRKYDRPTKYSGFAKDDFSSFFKLLDQLASRELTGNAAANAVTNILGLFTKETAEYLERVLDKDLKAGFSDETYNKIHKDNPIPVFSVMLADKCDDTDDFEEYVTFPCQADLKYDGERTIAVVKKDEIIYYSRSGKEATHVAGLFDEDLYSIHKHLGYDFILDGERISDKGFTDTVNAKKSGNDEAKANLRFRAFFLMPLKDWQAQSTKITMRENRKNLDSIISSAKCKKIILSEGREVKNYHDMMEFCNEAIDKPENAARKIEGLILKNYDSTYSWKRTFAWTKVKRFFDVDARIVGFYPGRPKSRLEKAGLVGGVNCVGFLESGERVEFNVGSGFSDAQRKDMADNPQKWLDATHVIKYQDVTKAKNKKYSSLRFCTYEHARDDKTVEV